MVRASGRQTYALDSLYPLGGDGAAQIVENCEDQTLFERCPWQAVLTMAPGAELEHRLDEEMTRLRGELADYAQRMVDPAPFVQPGIADFLYDTAVAFSGNDAGIFVPISVLARVCKIIEFLASLLLFGAVVSRLWAAAAAQTGRP